MNRKTRGAKPASSVSPYETLKATPIWVIVDNAINDLVKNKDLVETTRRDYIVGYICEKLQRALPALDD
jgi:hypothetical protein